jgi:hydrogenase maturation protease
VSRLLIVGLGNSLMGDDGVGPRAVEQLLAAGLPKGVRACQGETDVLRLLGLWEGEGQVWLIDALRSGQTPGTITRVDHDELRKAQQPQTTIHHLSLPESLRWMTLSEPRLQEVTFALWGVEPASIEPATGLSPAVEKALDQLLPALQAALEQELQTEGS